MVALKLTEQEALDAIRQVLDQASEDHRAVIESMFLAEFSSQEIMELYGWSASKFYTTKHRALRWLRDRLMTLYGPDVATRWLP